MIDANWIKTSDKKPALRRLGGTTNCARSSFVLGAFRYDGDWYFNVTKYVRGGQGDDSTCYWWSDDGEPLFWTALPKHPSLKAASVE